MHGVVTIRFCRLPGNDSDWGIALRRAKGLRPTGMPS